MQQLPSIMLGFGKCKYQCSCTNNFTCNVLGVRIKKKKNLNRNLC